MAEKQMMLTGLVEAIRLTNRFLTHEQKQDIDNLQFKMEFKLKELVERTKLEEADIKISTMQQVLNTVSNVKK